MKAERDALKEGRSLLREGSDMRFAFIAKHRSILPVAWLNRCSSVRSRPDEALVTTIDRSFRSSDRIYGARRIWHDILATAFPTACIASNGLCRRAGCGPGHAAAGRRRMALRC